MTTVNGDLVNVLGVKQDGVVRIASSFTRPDGSQVIVDDWDEVYIKAGRFTANVAGGPARFHVVVGSTSKIFNVVVPKTGTVSFASLLEEVVEWSPEVVSRAAMEARAAAESAKAAAKSASDAKAGADRVGTAEQVGKWAESAGSSADAASRSATAAAGSASAAKADADRAKSSADSAGSSASGAKSSADAAKGSADAAGKSAVAAAGSASAAKVDAGKAATSATNAGKSATAAKADADRAENVIDNVDWHDDRLMVMGKISPPLTGPKGDKGEPGKSGASTWDTVSGKPSAFPPEAHKHKMADISDLPKVSPYGDPNTIMQRSSSGHAILNANATPTSIAHVTHKKYVDDRDAATLAEARALVGSRPAFFSGSGAPPSSIPGAVVGDYYLDETTMELHKITGV
ncbi:hypothetical protein [Corynebacterium macclintockiae]|uniref:hypothetical protein n=1 Tax=Corynebacterium macclintockiae TaxID=2913501 RepID=UPI003EB89D6E